ncbi:hypothetical protein EVAR_76280_1 [Eumeta japonica]|uniref:Uncharacterized protein n=1 Tax=Eumeta variegata TaxID=151549 RepID=A0A4C1UP31_EUMVA|nr:hypothetical protein EVAR_76280_1 [Eumeta japonica]
MNPTGEQESRVPRRPAPAHAASTPARQERRTPARFLLQMSSSLIHLPFEVGVRRYNVFVGSSGPRRAGLCYLRQQTTTEPALAQRRGGRCGRLAGCTSRAHRRTSSALRNFHAFAPPDNTHITTASKRIAFECLRNNARG